MNTVSLSILVCISTTLHPQEPTIHMTPPKLHFTYDWRGKTIDVIGYYLLSNKFDFKKVTNTNIMQIHEELQECKTAWEQEGPILFNEVFTVFHRGFLTQHITAVLFFGTTAGYAGNGALVLGLSFLQTAETWHNSISPKEYFKWLLFHELLHTWLDDNLGSNQTELLKKYQDETSEVREHIHLMAIQKMVYLKLKRLDLVEFCDQCYRRNPDGYRRSWEIVNDIEGHEQILQDLMKMFTQQEAEFLPQDSLWTNTKRYANVIKDIFDKTFW